MEFYQWLLVLNGFKVSNTGYFVYTTGDNTLPSFNDQLKFRTHLIPYTGSYEWVENTLDKLIVCASSKNIPAASNECPFCMYAKSRKNL